MTERGIYDTTEAENGTASRSEFDAWSLKLDVWSLTLGAWSLTLGARSLEFAAQIMTTTIALISQVWVVAT